VVLFGLFGYGVLGVTLAVLTAACVGLGWTLLQHHGGILAFKLAWFLVPLIWIIARSLWVRIEAPDGLEIHPPDAPLLFERVEGVRRKLGAPRVDSVLLTADLNAAVAHVPWLGLAGPGKTYLILGLPLLQAMSEPQVTAVLAHEFGHVSGRHGRLGAWVYRARLTWGRLGARLAGSHASAPLRAFASWYVPRFQARSLALARTQELQADQSSAEVAGTRTAADALILTRLQAKRCGAGFWTELIRRNRNEPQPPPGLFGETRSLLTAPLAEDLASRWMQQDLVEPEEENDTHPPLAERLERLGEPARVPEVGLPASRTLLGTAEARLEQALDGWWRTEHAEAWSHHYQGAERGRRRLKELEERRARTQLSVDEAWERADLLEDFQGEETALPHFQEVLSRLPAHPRANLSVGRILAMRDDAGGLAFLERAAAGDRRLEGPVNEVLLSYWSRQGRREEVKALASRRGDWIRQMALAQVERSTVTIQDALKPHGLDGQEVETLTGQLATLEDIAEAWLVQKVLKRFPEDRLYVLAVRAGGALRYRGAVQVRQLSARMQAVIELPGKAIFVDVRTHPALGSHIQGAAGAPIYRRAR
jgi:Zn-dependent protease with chaperone function